MRAKALLPRTSRRGRWVLSDRRDHRTGTATQITGLHTVHPDEGDHGIDCSYVALGTYVNEHLISSQGPIREHYLGGTPTDPGRFTATEICWPIFSTTAPR